MSSCCKPSVLCCNTTRIEKDVFERCYTFTSVAVDDQFILWEGDGVINTCGTLVLDVEVIDPTGGAVELFLNGDVVNPVVMDLVEGDSIVLTSDPLSQIVIGITTADTTVRVNLCLTINYECC